MVTVWESKCLKNEPVHQIQPCMLLNSLYSYNGIVGSVLLSTFVLSVCALIVLTVPPEEPKRREAPRPEVYVESIYLRKFYKLL